MDQMNIIQESLKWGSIALLLVAYIALPISLLMSTFPLGNPPVIPSTTTEFPPDAHVSFDDPTLFPANEEVPPEAGVQSLVVHVTILVCIFVNVILLIIFSFHKLSKKFAVFQSSVLWGLFGTSIITVVAAAYSTGAIFDMDNRRQDQLSGDSYHYPLFLIFVVFILQVITIVAPNWKSLPIESYVISVFLPLLTVIYGVSSLVILSLGSWKNMRRQPAYSSSLDWNLLVVSLSQIFLIPFLALLDLSYAVRNDWTRSCIVRIIYMAASFTLRVVSLKSFGKIKRRLGAKADVGSLLIPGYVLLVALLIYFVIRLAILLLLISKFLSHPMIQRFFSKSAPPQQEIPQQESPQQESPQQESPQQESPQQVEIEMEDLSVGH